MPYQPLHCPAQRGGPIQVRAVGGAGRVGAIGQDDLVKGCAFVAAVSTGRLVQAFELRGHTRLSVIISNSIVPKVTLTPCAPARLSRMRNANIPLAREINIATSDRTRSGLPSPRGLGARRPLRGSDPAPRRQLTRSTKQS
jgi:hypothetical protein